MCILLILLAIPTNIFCILSYIFIVVPEVMINASRTTVIADEDAITIECFVLRGNPSNYSYSITHIDTANTTSDSFLMLPVIQEADLGTYRCDVTNDAGTGSASVTIKEGGKKLNKLIEVCVVRWTHYSIYSFCSYCH